MASAQQPAGDDALHRRSLLLLSIWLVVQKLSVELIKCRVSAFGFVLVLGLGRGISSFFCDGE